MSEVLSGHFDLRVPVVMAVIDVYTKLSISDVVVELVVSERPWVCQHFALRVFAVAAPVC